MAYKPNKPNTPRKRRFIAVREDLWRRVRTTALLRGESASEVIEAALAHWFERKEAVA